MSNDIARNRGGSSRCDFFGVEPRLVSPAPSERRPSQLAGINLALQALINECRNRPRPVLNIEDSPSILCSTSSTPVQYIDLSPLGCNKEEIEHITVLFPWMQVSVLCSTEITLVKLKAEVFEKLKRMNVSSFSMEPSDYVFRAFRQSSGELEILYNEDFELYKLDLTTPFPFLFLFEPEGARHEKEFSRGVGQALGLSVDVLDQDLSDELKAYRASLWRVTNETVRSRGSGGYDHYAFPEEDLLDLKDECPSRLVSKINASKMKYILFYRSRDAEEEGIDADSLSVEVPFCEDFDPQLLISKALEKLTEREIQYDNEEYLLQIAGRKSFLTRSRRLVAFSVVRSCLSNYVDPVFVLRRKSIVLKNYPKPRPLVKPYYVLAEETRAEMDPKDTLPSLWTVDENLLIRPITYSNMGGYHDYNSTIVVTFSFYVGSVILSQVASREISPRNPRWFEPGIYTGIYMKDVPESLILSIQVFELRRDKIKKPAEAGKNRDIDGNKDTYSGYPEFFQLVKEKNEEESKGKKSKDNEERMPFNQVGWVNLPMYDWQGEMQLGNFTVALWTSDYEAPPNGKIGAIDTKIHGRSASQCRLTFETTTTVTSRESSGRRHCRVVDDIQWKEFYDARHGGITRDEEPEKDPEAMPVLEKFLERRFLGEGLQAKEQKFVWDRRNLIAVHLPDALLLLMETRLMWETREAFGDIYTKLMCGGWGDLSIPAAITILSSKCTDRLIRKFAAQQIDFLLNNHDFALFILPLIQALKCEMYADSDVAHLLLKRSLSDYRLGHKCFWLLRAELIGLREGLSGHSNPELFKRFALLIEAYLRGNDEHITTILKQIEMVEFLSKVSSVVKTYKDRDAASKRLREELRENCILMENIDSPLDPSDVLGELIIDKCKVLGSAKMPLRLSWKNVNPLSDHHLPVHEIIFKNGDDLRQDMLVLQVLEVMDSVWKRNQLDCCLSPYPVLPTGVKVGMIGVVPNCSTIFEIQSEGGKMGTAVKSLETTFLNKYVRNIAVHSKVYLECVDRFLMSCVGYSVATFIMGIKDRHNDNIMLTRDGKLLHIDFGHILGHGKTKLGIQRDRVPFVLTEHFLCLIAKGNPVSKSSHDVVKFRQLCGDAYLMLWEERLLFSSLFTAMRSMDLPELSTEADLDHLKKTLRVDDSNREEAGQFFSEIFDEAFNGSWSTKTNWFFHTVKHL